MSFEIHNLLSFFLELFKIMLMLCGLLGFKIQPDIRFCLLCMTFPALVFVISKSEYSGAISFILGIFAVLTAVFLIKGKNRLLFSILSYFSISLFDTLVASAVFYCFEIDYKFLRSNYLPDLAVNSVSFAILLITTIIRYFIDRNNQPRISIIKKAYIISFILGELTVGIYMTPIQALGLSGTHKSIFAFAAGTSGVLFIFLSLILVKLYYNKQIYKELFKTSSEFIDKQKGYYEEISKRSKESRKAIHDFKFHLRGMFSLFKDNKSHELEDYFISLLGKAETMPQNIQTGNHILNAIIFDYTNKYSKVKFNLIGKFPDELKISHVDVCVIFSNILENAFRAADKCKSNKYVILELKYLNKNICIILTNAYSGEIERKGLKFITNKNDTLNHGFGIINMIDSVSKYGGAVNFEYSADIFSVKIIIPNALE